jgi:16S rRNA (guanine966-N2)-methyltransferase
VLDLFAGSGALGFEAASRGATQVVLVERDHRAIDALHEARARLKADEVEIVAGDARHAVAGLSARRFDLVFFDPPFGEDWMTRVWADVVPLLAPDALVYVEAGEAIEPPEGMAVLRRAKAGSVHYCLLQPAGATPPDEA